MKPLAAEWAAKAEGDLQTARREMAATDSPNYDAVCFHAQQCVEKYFKARLADGGVTFPKIHDLAALLDLAIPNEPAWASLRDELDSLSSRAVEVRYPGVDSDAEDARGALEIALRVRAVVRPSLGLTV